MHASRIEASRAKSATCSTSSRNVGSAHCRSSIAKTSGRSAARCSSNVGSPRTSPPVRSAPAIRSPRPPGPRPCLRRHPPRERLEFGAGHLGRVGLVQTRDLDERLGQGVERDALAVGQATATEDGRPIARLVEEPPISLDLPTPPMPRTVNSWQASVAHRPLEGAPQERELSLPPHHRVRRGAGRTGRARRDLDEAEREQRIGLSLGEHVDRVHDSPRCARARRCASPSRISPGAAACSRRAATFTASPVAIRWPADRRPRPRRCSPRSGRRG